MYAVLKYLMFSAEAAGIFKKPAAEETPENSLNGMPKVQGAVFAPNLSGKRMEQIKFYALSGVDCFFFGVTLKVALFYL